jgi:hypothetical protein
LVLPGQELLGHRVAIVVRKNVEGAELAIPDESFAQVGLLHHAVPVRIRLVAEAESQQVHGNQTVSPAKVGPHRYPIPRRSGEAVDQQHGRLVELS